MRITLCIIGLMLILTTSLSSIEKREVPLHLTTSIIIPCHVKHFPMLKELFDRYAMHQVVIPDEVVVSLCSVSSLSKAGYAHLRSLQQTKWPFSLKILMHSDVLSAGANRNRACAAAQGDILICQDADDLPYPQRIEVIKWFFENYHIDHLMHAFIESCEETIPTQRIDPEKVRWETPSQYEIIHNIANGPIAMSRCVFKEVQWEEELLHGEDVIFNHQVYNCLFKTVILHEPLYLYRRGIASMPYQ